MTSNNIRIIWSESREEDSINRYIECLMQYQDSYVFAPALTKVSFLDEQERHECRIKIWKETQNILSVMGIKFDSVDERLLIRVFPVSKKE